MVKCQECEYFRWKETSHPKAHFVIAGCVKLHLVFGTKQDMERNKDQPDKKLVAMPNDCLSFRNRHETPCES